MTGKSPETKHESADRFESDTQKVVRKHLEDPNHTITDEEIRNVRIGMTPVMDDNDEDSNEESGSEIEGANDTDNDTDGEPKDEPTTPWDKVEH